MLTSEKIYNLNAYISLHFIGLGRVPEHKEMVTINQTLGEVIKEVREFEQLIKDKEDGRNI